VRAWSKGVGEQVEQEVETKPVQRNEVKTMKGSYNASCQGRHYDKGALSGRKNRPKQGNTEKKDTQKRANSHSLEEAEQIVVLAVDVAAHFDGGFQLQQDGLGHKHVPRVDAQVFDFVLRQLHLFFTGQ